MTFVALVPVLALLAGVAWQTHRARLRSALRDVEAMERELHLGDAERRALGLVATGAPPRAVLGTLAHGVEHLFPGRHCTILLVDESGKTLTVGGLGSAASSLGAALDCLPIQRCVSPCAEAARANVIVAVDDVRVDARCGGVRDVLLPLGLRAYWSAPVRDADGLVVGTLALHSARTGLPQPHEALLLEGIAGAAGRVFASLERERLARDARGRLAVADRPDMAGFWDAGLVTTTH